MAPIEARRCEWLVLGEDRQHQNFVYHWLRGRGVPRAKIRLLPLSAGRGAGEQHVRQQYASQVEDLRRRNYLAAALVVVLDADVETVEAHHLELAARIARTPDDRVALAIPRRNIETWIRYLTAPPVDEETDYKRRERDAEACRRAGLALANLRAPPADAPDSLRRFFAEIDRVA